MLGESFLRGIHEDLQEFRVLELRRWHRDDPLRRPFLAFVLLFQLNQTQGCSYQGVSFGFWYNMCVSYTLNRSWQNTEDKGDISGPKYLCTQGNWRNGRVYELHDFVQTHSSSLRSCCLTRKRVRKTAVCWPSTTSSVLYRYPFFHSLYILQLRPADIIIVPIFRWRK